MGRTDWFREQKVLEGSRNKQTEQKQKGPWLFQNRPACHAERGWGMEEPEKNWLANTRKFHAVSFVRGIRHKKHLYCFDLNWPVRANVLASCCLAKSEEWLISPWWRAAQESLHSLCLSPWGLCRALNGASLCLMPPS